MGQGDPTLEQIENALKEEGCTAGSSDIEMTVDEQADQDVKVQKIIDKITKNNLKIKVMPD